MESKGLLNDQACALPPHTPPPVQTESQATSQPLTITDDISMTTPQTPLPQITSTPPILEPPDPPKIRIKRRRPGQTPEDVPLEDDQKSLAPDSVPSIKLSVPANKMGSTTHDPLAQFDSLPRMSPNISRTRAHSAPRTPLRRLQTSFNNSPSGLKTPEPWSAQSLFSKAESITRPSSTWSELSDSSISSASSFGTAVTQGESCTSPESDLTDPFLPTNSKLSLVPSAIPKDLQRLGQRVRRHSESVWTSEMDDHLWLSYMTYLSDPTVTPFKTLPGTAPPLGVCHRVARRAKKSWKGSRTVLTPLDEHRATTFASIDATVLRRESSLPAPGSPSTTVSPTIGRSFSAGARRHPTKWPYTGSATRKRLRALCKYRPALSPHYQRLMHSRSPSPFESSSSQGRHTSPPRYEPEQSAFTTRHLNVMLTTSTASSMQPGNPLSQLSSSGLRTPQRSSPHVKSSSLQSTFGVTNDQQHRQGLASLRQLASPFQEKPRETTVPGPRSSDRSALRPAQAFRHLQPQPQQRRLASPLEIHQPRPMTASMKRRAQYQLGEELLSDDPELRQSFLEDIFRDPATHSGKRRVRSRGFSLGAVRHASAGSASSSRQLSELFTPPATTDEQQFTSSVQQTKQPPLSQPGTGFLGPSHVRPQPRLMPTSALGTDAACRLGSPFAPAGNVGMSNTFPRSLFPQGLDSISNLETQRQQQELSKPDVEMEDPFVDTPAGPAATAPSVRSSGDPIRRYQAE